jgi:hypothetical protein
MQRKTSHWLMRAVFLPLSVALAMGASLAAAGKHSLGDEGHRSSASDYLDRVRSQPGPLMASEEQKPQSSAPTQPLTPSHEQPWQTSWEAFCGELQRLYKRGVTAEEKNALFTGKAVTWERAVNRIDRVTNSIELDGFCEVTTADNRSEYVFVLFSLHFSRTEIQDDLRESARVRFAMTLAPLFRTPDTGQERADKPTPQFDYIFGADGTVQWQDSTIQEQMHGPQWWDPIDTIIINSEAKLLEYEKLPEDSERNLEGLGKQLEKLLERRSQEKHNQER